MYEFFHQAYIGNKEVLQQLRIGKTDAEIKAASANRRREEKEKDDD